jgi:hypothetical protein
VKITQSRKRRATQSKDLESRSAEKYRYQIFRKSSPVECTKELRRSQRAEFDYLKSIQRESELNIGPGALDV